MTDKTMYVSPSVEIIELRGSGALCLDSVTIPGFEEKDWD